MIDRYTNFDDVLLLTYSKSRDFFQPIAGNVIFDVGQFIRSPLDRGVNRAVN